jgi:hypothetical protein
MSNVTRNTVLSLTVGFALLLGGCASTANFSEPIASFATAVKADQAVLQIFDRIADADMLDKNLDAALKNEYQIPTPVDSCGMTAKRCQLVMVAKDMPQVTIKLKPDAKSARVVISAIVDYAANMQAIAAMDTQSGVDAAYAKAMTNFAQAMSDAGTLAVSSAEGAQLKTYSSQFSGLAKMALDGYFEERKLQALRRGAEEMDNIFPYLLQLCEAAAHIGYSTEKVVLQANYWEAADAFNKFKPLAVSQKHGRLQKKPAANAGENQDASAARRKLLVTAYTAALAYDDLLSNDPDTALDALRTAHGALYIALQTPGKEQLAAAQDAAKKAADAAQKVQTAVKLLDGGTNSPSPAN